MKRLSAVLAMVGVLAGCSAATGVTLPTAEPTTVALGGSAKIAAALAKVQVVAERPDVPGYDRSCKKGDGCSFGQPWKDVDRNGCDTRNDVLKAQLTNITVRLGGCVVTRGTLQDPYTGRQIAFRKSQASKVQIDHVYPLGRAWDMGASKWTADRRLEFANDQEVQLLAVDGSANESKGDDGPGEWIPVNKAYRCAYVLRYLQVADKYDLPITKADADTARAVLPSCGGAR